MTSFWANSGTNSTKVVVKTQIRGNLGYQGIAQNYINGKPANVLEYAGSRVIQSVSIVSYY